MRSFLKNNQIKKIVTGYVAVILILGFCFIVAENNIAQAQSSTNIDDISQKIKERTDAIQKLDAEKKILQKQLDATNNTSQTLKNAINQLDLSRKKLDTELKITQQKIGSAELTIEQISNQIKSDEEKLAIAQKALSESIRAVRAGESQSIVEAILSSPSLSTFFNEVNTRGQYQVGVTKRMDEIIAIRKDLDAKKTDAESQKKNLVSLKTDLSGKKQAVEATKKDTNTLLTATKSQEANYKKLIAQKEEQAAAFEKELFSYEAALKLAIDPKSFPSQKPGILAWPIENPVVTQKFGRTVDAKRLYVSGSHNGMDFRATPGTAIKAALAGVVEGVDNTDLSRGCYSYGKWILIKHANGLSTIYSHLSTQVVKVGETVSTGQIIGYSGSTGYATGPHLHFGVFASQGIRVQKYTSSINCKGVSIPMGDIKAYLDPSVYLPS